MEAVNQNKLYQMNGSIE